ncbi:MAG TPA: hypothetical protein VNZ57_09345 [Longimicrobiales bacterium]|nr:hypothetical protein [Longimicrobiales bacterium]
MEEIFASLLELQELDAEIDRAEEVSRAFGPELENLTAPVESLARDLEAVRVRLQEMRDTVRRLERSANEKRERLRRYQDRLNLVRNPREEAAVQAELDLIRRATDADEQETLELMEQITRTELKADDLDRQLAAARMEMEPKRAELLERKAQAEDALARLRDRRENLAIRLDMPTRRLYERVRAGRTRVVLAPLADGACGHCFSMIPIQQQHEIRLARSLYRCEACGVILYLRD